MPNSIYQEAAASVAAPLTITHVGAPGTVAVAVANTAAAGGTTESLVASLSSASGGFALAGVTVLSDPSGSGGTFATGLNDAGTVVGYYDAPSSGTGAGTQQAAAAGTELPTSFTWTAATGFANIGSVAPETADPGNGTTIPPNPSAPDGYGYVASGITGPSAVSYFGNGADPVFNGTIILGTAQDATGTANDPYYGAYGANALVDSAQARISSAGTAYPTFTTPAYANVAPESFLSPGSLYQGPGISGSGSYASLTEVSSTGTATAVGDFGTGLVPFTALGTLVGAVDSWSGGVNDSHEYSGTYEDASGRYHGFTGAVNASGTFVFGGTFDVAGAVNTVLTSIDDNGDVAGWYTDSSGAQHGFADYQGVVAPIDLGAGRTAVTGINDSGEVTGYYLTAGGTDAGFAAQLEQTAPVAAGASGPASLALSFSTASAGTITGTATVALSSDGSTVAGDTAGITPLGSVTVGVTVVVDNYATAALSEIAGAGTLAAAGAGAYALNLGTVLQGSAAPSATLAVANAAPGPADLLSGSFAESGATAAFVNTGLASFGSLAAGGTSAGETVSLSTAQAGTFTETVTLAATGSNAGGYSGALAPETVTVTGTVAPVREAAASVAAPLTITHVGAPGTVAVAVANTAAAGGTTESLVASLSSASGGFALAGVTVLSDPSGSGGTFATGLNDAGTVVGYYDAPSSGTGAGTQQAAAAGTELPTSFTWTAATGFANIGSVAPETADPGNGTTIPPNPSAPDGYGYVASGITGPSAVSYFGNGADPVFNGTIILGTAQDATGTANDPYYGAYGANALVDSAQARISSAGTAYPTFTTPAYANVAPESFLSPGSLYQGPGISGSGSYASLTEVSSTGTATAVGDFGTGLVPFTALGTLVGAVDSWSGGVNDSHEYSGTYEDASGRYHGFTGAVNASGTFVFGGTFDVAGAVNTVLTSIDDNGDVAGWYTDSSGAQHGFADYQGVVAPIDLGAGRTAVTGINDSGEVTGYYLTAGGTDAGFAAQLEQTAPVAAGASGPASLALSFSTASAGTITGTATVALSSDGSTVAGDTAGITPLGSVTVGVTVVVDNYATAALSEIAGAGTLAAAGAGAYALNLGTVLQGSAAPSATLAVANAAPGPADLLSGSFAESGATAAFVNTGLASFGSLAAGGTSAGETVSLSTAQAGTFTETVTLAATGSNAGGYSGALAPETVTVTGTVAPVQCFAAGTRIRCDRGEVAVEEVRAGDRAWSMLGQRWAPVVWVGYRHVDCARHPKPQAVWPVRVSAGAFGPGAPVREAWLSPDHAVYVEGVLVPVRYLVNGTTITQVRRDSVTYYHVELVRHDVILAEGLPAESYLDTGGRSNFANGGAATALHPDFSRAGDVWEMAGCAPMVICGPELDAARLFVNVQAATMPSDRNAA